jgi:hypothetical protein
MASMGDAQRVGQGGLSKLTDGPRTTSDLSKVGGGLTRGPNQGKKLNAAAWSETWPAPQSTLDLDFANDRGWVRGVGQGKSMDAVTFTRASNGNYVKPDGTLSSHANQGALGNNLLTFPQDFDNGAWGKTNATVQANVEIAPDSSQTADYLVDNTVNGIHRLGITYTAANGVSHTLSVYAKKNQIVWMRLIGIAANLSAYYDLENGVTGTVSAGVTASMSDAGNGWWRCSYTCNGDGAAVVLAIQLALANGGTTYIGNGESGIFIWGAQLEPGSTATEYFPTNIGQPRFDWASTASTGAGTIADPRIIPLAANPTSNGLLIEESRANRILWCRDATQANWTKTNVTAAKDQTGIDGVANAASSLTATANDGTCIQTITLASGSRTGSVYLKRITGTGNVQVSLDGSTYSTVDLSASEWRRIVLSGTVTNPTVGIKIAVSGDAVAMDYGQVEDGAGASSPILTTTASVTRASDVATISGVNFKPEFFRSYYGAIYTETQLTAQQGERYYWRLQFNTSGRSDGRYANASIGTAFGNTITIDVTKPAKALFRWDAGNINLTANGIIGPRSTLNLEFFTYIPFYEINNMSLAIFGSGYVKRHTWIASKISAESSVVITK